MLIISESPRDVGKIYLVPENTPQQQATHIHRSYRTVPRIIQPNQSQSQTAGQVHNQVQHQVPHVVTAVQHAQATQGVQSTREQNSQLIPNGNQGGQMMIGIRLKINHLNHLSFKLF